MLEYCNENSRPLFTNSLSSALLFLRETTCSVCCLPQVASDSKNADSNCAVEYPCTSHQVLMLYWPVERYCGPFLLLTRQNGAKTILIEYLFFFFEYKTRSDVYSAFRRTLPRLCRTFLCSRLSNGTSF